MKVECNKERFRSAFSKAALFSPQRSPRQVLTNVLVTATTDGKLTFNATDNENGVRITLSGVKVDKPGSVLLPVPRVRQLLDQSTDEEITITQNQTNVVIRGARFSCKLPVENPSDFPSLPERDVSIGHEIPGTTLKQLVTRTAIAVDADNTNRYTLGGLLFEFYDAELLTVATDGKRLAVMRVPATMIGSHVSGEQHCIVPKSAVDLLVRTFGDSSEVVRLTMRDNDIVASNSHVTFIARRLEGRFPAWRQIVPEEAASLHAADFIVGPLHAAIRQAGVTTNEESRGIDFEFASGELSLSSSTAGVGQTSVTLPIEYEAAKTTFCLSKDYAADVLKALPADSKVRMRFTDGENATVFATDDGYQYVLMPMMKD